MTRPMVGPNLELLETRRFGTGVTHLRYRIRGASRSAWRTRRRSLDRSA